MPSIGHLGGVRGSCRGPLNIVVTSVTTDDLHAGMCAEPSLERFRRTLGQQIDYAVTFQIAKDGAVTLATAESPVINTQDTGSQRRRALVDGE